MDNKLHDEKLIINAGEPIEDADMEGVSGGAVRTVRYPMHCPNCKQYVGLSHEIISGDDGLCECSHCGHRDLRRNFVHIDP